MCKGAKSEENVVLEKENPINFISLNKSSRVPYGT